MFTQPSVNQIASAYQGNPAPLARKVDQDKKQNGGIPKDLRQLMALNDIAQGKEAVGIDQALKIPTNMPTVAQNTQQLAQQALQARMLQQAREQQRLQQQPPTVPQGIAQPQGLDALRTNVGEGYAEGGIIGFDGKTGSDVKDPNQKEKDEKSLAEQREADRRSLLTIPAAILDLLQLPASAGYNLAADAGSAIESGLNRLGSALTNENINTQSDSQVGNKFRFSPTPFTDKLRQPTERQVKVAEQDRQKNAVMATDPATIRSQLNLADADVRAQPGTPPPPRERPVAQTQTRVETDSAPMPGGLKDLAGIPSTSAAYKKLTEMMNQDPEAKAQQLRDRYMKEVGSRDLSVYDKAAAELQARKERLNAPKAGYDATMEFLQQIAQSGGRTWMEAGSRGAAGVNALRKSRLSEQDALMEKILDLGAKKSEAQFAEKKGMFDMTSKERDDIFKQAFDAAKSVNASDDEAKRIAAQAVENEKNRKNQIRAAQIGAQDRDNLMSRAKALMAADPTKTLTLEQAMQKAAEIAAAGTMESAGVRNRKAYDDAVEKLNSDLRYMPIRLDKKNDPKNAILRTEYENKIKELQARYGVAGQGLNALPTSTGLPAGVTVTQIK